MSQQSNSVVKMVIIRVLMLLLLLSNFQLVAGQNNQRSQGCDLAAVNTGCSVNFNRQHLAISASSPNKLAEVDVEQNNTLSMGVVSIVLALIGVLVFFVLNNKRKNKLGLVSDDVEFNNTAYGYLIPTAPQAGQRILLDTRVSKIGRSQHNDIIINDQSVSAHHAQINYEQNGDVILIDLNSTHGSRVNGQTILKRKLELGDEIELGTYQLRFGGIK